MYVHIYVWMIYLTDGIMEVTICMYVGMYVWPAARCASSHPSAAAVPRRRSDAPFAAPPGTNQGVTYCTGVRRFEELIDLPGRGWSPRRSLSSEHLHEILKSCIHTVIHTFIHWDIFKLQTCQHANIHTYILYIRTYHPLIPVRLLSYWGRRSGYPDPQRLMSSLARKPAEY